MFRRTLVGLALACTPAIAAAQAAPPADDHAAILDVVHRLFDGMRRVDSAMVRPLFHARARLITTSTRNGATVTQVEDSVEGFIRSIGRPRSEVFDERLSNTRVMMDGALASVWSDYAFYRGATLSHCGVDHFLLVKEAGAWKIIELADTRRTAGC